MNQLKVISLDGQLVTESRDVAEMVGKEHSHLLRDIDSYIQVLGKSNFGLSDFFRESTYQAGTRSYKCYLLTRKGCDMVANKMTGEKGVLFTAAYVTRFEEMEQVLNKPKSQLEIMQMQIDQMIKQEKRLNEQDNRIEKIETEQQNITEIIGLSVVEWRKKVTNILNRIAKNNGGFEMYQEIRNESYNLLEERAKCKLSIRVTNKQKVMALNGVPKSTVNKVSKLDAISEDARLTEIYLAIVKELAIKYRVSFTDFEVI
ncbi:Rha family transcriptional regulator [Psychrobacillus psychrodurans]|uniref:Rha family transcriptional regulator n=1 Tax=Psychrobacillus psychrodurans TaxID=126157 RepID=UPI001F4E4E1E|nr:Rha family transcriptional regulator [Psychrobacillus psychrodurans]MCK1996472.1 Rha family transcriptional regulator [Psychrobacillus psychrodurans]